MATYGDTAQEYPYKVEKRRKQKYSLITRVIDLTNNLPVTDAAGTTTAWAAGDVLEAIGIRAGQTVLGVQLEILTKSGDSGDVVDIGYGSDAVRWGRFNLSDSTGVKDTLSHSVMIEDIFLQPLYFAAKDTIDITIRKAAIQGKIRLIVHVLEDDR